MSDVIEQGASTALVAVAERASNGLAMTHDQVALVKRTVCRPSKRQATDDELALFLHQAQRLGLDPLANQIYAVFRWDSRANDEVMTVQSSIDGIRLGAERSGKYAGQTPTYWADGAGEWHEVWLSNEKPAAAKVGVYRKGAPEPVWGVATWSSYRVTDRKGNLTPFWRRMPEVMLAKCAEAVALRKAFPAELSGVYSDDEMAQADAPPPAPSQVTKREPVAELPAASVDRLTEALGRVRPKFDRLCVLIGATGADAPKLNRKDSITKALRALTSAQAEELETALHEEADRGE